MPRSRIGVEVYSTQTGEPFLRASIEIVNEASDHRVRALFPLGTTATSSHADGAFYVNERGLEAACCGCYGVLTVPAALPLA